ncbi:MAG: sulfatase-like hydrolase/transferase [Planctomycetaceae bacterium]|nr:sulfatase-like hydrolase/transferase [Planctomycetaceae bacterium]
MQQADGASHQPGAKSTVPEAGSGYWTLLGCCAFAVAQPLFVRLSTQSAFLLDTGTTPLRLVCLTFLIYFGPPTLLWIAECLAGRVSLQLRSRVHRSSVAMLVACFCLLVGRSLLNIVILKQQGLAGLLTIALAIAGFLAAWRAMGRRRLQSVFRIAAIGSLAFPAWFLNTGAAATILTSLLPQPPTVVGKPAPVVMLILDEICGLSLQNEQREIDAVRYPNFARLAGTANWYRNATTVHARTPFAVPALLTGRLPLSDREMTRAEAPQNLFTLLDSAGYRTAAFEPVTRLYPDDKRKQQADVPFCAWAVSMQESLLIVYLHALTPSDMSLGLPAIPNVWHGVNQRLRDLTKMRAGVFRDAGDTDLQFNHFLNCLPQSTERALCVLHCMSPHCPWTYLPSGEKYLHQDDIDQMHIAGTGYLGEHWAGDEILVQQAWQRYLLQLGDTDRRLGIVLDHLEQAGLFDQTLIVVAGDHGVSFRAGHSRRLPDGDSLADILSVPLLIKLPGQTSGTVSDRNVESIDVLPTIAAALELELALPVDGDSLLDGSMRARSRKSLGFPGGSTVVSAEFHEQHEALDDMLDLFGSGTGDDQLWRPLGPIPELIGAAVSDFEELPSRGIAVRVMLGRRSGLIDDGATCQYLEGVVIDSPEAEPLALALVADGKVIGTAHVAIDAEIAGHWGCLMTDLRHVPQTGEVRIFIVHPSEAGAGLEPCEIVPEYSADS